MTILAVGLAILAAAAALTPHASARYVCWLARRLGPGLTAQPESGSRFGQAGEDAPGRSRAGTPQDRRRPR